MWSQSLARPKKPLANSMKRPMPLESPRPHKERKQSPHRHLLLHRKHHHHPPNSQPLPHLRKSLASSADNADKKILQMLCSAVHVAQVYSKQHKKAPLLPMLEFWLNSQQHNSSDTLSTKHVAAVTISTRCLKRQRCRLMTFQLPFNSTCESCIKYIKYIWYFARFAVPLHRFYEKSKVHSVFSRTDYSIIHDGSQPSVGRQILSNCRPMCC